MKILCNPQWGWFPRKVEKLGLFSTYHLNSGGEKGLSTATHQKKDAKSDTGTWTMQSDNVSKCCGKCLQHIEVKSR